MAQTFKRAVGRFRHQVRRRWWLVFLFIIWEIAKDRVAAWANAQIDKEIGAVMKTTAQAIEYAASSPLTWTILVAVAVVLFLFIHSYLVEHRKIRQTSDQLGDQLAELSRDILEFLSERQRIQPSLPRRRTWNKDTNGMIQHSSGTVSLYHKKFGAKVIRYYEEAKNRGYQDDQIEPFYKYPTNELGIRDLGQRLGALGIKIKDSR